MDWVLWMVGGVVALAVVVGIGLLYVGDARQIRERQQRGQYPPSQSENPDWSPKRFGW